jgi:hypothetical protein
MITRHKPIIALRCGGAAMGCLPEVTVIDMEYLCMDIKGSETA